MSTVNIDLSSDTQLNMILGQQDETEVREVVFDFSGWYTTYGSGTISLSVQRSKDQWPYEVELTVDNTNHTATWTITDTDTGYAGVGMVQITYTVGTAKKKSVVYRFTVYKSLGATGNVITPVQLQTWMDEVDQELTDIKQDLAELEGGGLSDEAKQALLACFQNVAWISDDGQDYYDALNSALYPPADLVSISAVYTESHTVLDTDDLDSLKTDLVVTAHMSDSTTRNVTTYTLSGTLAEGTNTITVLYSGKTTTFTVSCPHTTRTYIASTGTQWINTGFKIGYYDEISVTMRDDVTDLVDKTYWGVADASNHRVQIGPYKTNSSDNYSCRWTGDPIAATARVVGEICTMQLKNRGTGTKDLFIYDESGTQIRSAYTSGGSEANLPDLPFYIFTRNTNGVYGGISIWKLYEFIVWDQNHNERLHLIPVTKNNVACLYDAVSDDYLYNAGTGDFDYA